MPPHSIEVAETVVALKRALRREHEVPSNQQNYSATNRGNKLKKGSSYVHRGALPSAFAKGTYRQKVNHAGFDRYILDTNPKRYNEYGDELEQSESDREADADAEEENAYNGVKLEELLRPLTHPSELANHPTLARPFLDSALTDMIQTTEAKLRQERANLWRAKNLNRQFIGDESWVPLHSMEDNDDWDMFEPRQRAPDVHVAKKRKIDSAAGLAQNGIDGHDHANTNGSEVQMLDAQDQQDDTNMPSEVQDTASAPHESDAVKTDMRQGKEHENGVHQKIQEESLDDANRTQTNGVHIKEDPSANAGEPTVNDHEQHQNGLDQDNSDKPSERGTPPPPPRRITRALAANNTNAPTPPVSPTTTVNSSLLEIDPLFLLPATRTNGTRAAAHFSQLGLPVEEILETRRLLTMYIQKQEESVRGYEAVLGKLIKAKRMRDNVWEWSKSEGHVGEWSDGEDWVDAESWGLKPEELKKGKDEDEANEETETAGGRKGKRRRAARE